MKTILYLLMITALIGFGLSFAVHVAGWLNLGLPTYVFGLHVGVFIVYLPAGIVSMVQAYRHERRDFWKWNSWILALRRAPRWMQVVTAGIFVYAIVHFLASILLISPGRSPAPLAGIGSPFRIFSGHWMAFYWTAFALCYTYIHPQVRRR
jgi:hypothetical protein